MAISYGNIAGQEPSTVTFRAATVVIARGSTNEQQEILVIGDPQTSNAIARVVAAEPGSTEFGLITRMAGRILADQNSTVWATQSAQAGSWTVRSNLSSTSADNPVSAAQAGTWDVRNVSSLAGKVAVVNSSAADLVVRAVVSSTSADNPVTASQGGAWTVRATLSSTSADNPVNAAQVGSWTVRSNLSSTSADNPVSAAQSGSWAVRANLSSTGADNPVSIVGTVSVTDANSTTVTVSAFPGGLLSTSAPSSNSSGVIVRQVVDAILTTASTNAFASTSLSIQSSGAGLRSYVTAYSIMSTAAGPTKVAFYSGSSMRWPVIFAAVSSAISGANLAVSAPAYLFRTNAASALTLQTPSSVAGFKAAVSYFRAP